MQTQKPERILFFSTPPTMYESYELIVHTPQGRSGAYGWVDWVVLYIESA